MSLEAPQSAALRAYTDAVRRVEVSGLRPPASASDAASLHAFAGQARVVLRAARREADQAVAAADAAIQAAPRPGRTDLGYKALEDACRRIEQELVRPPTLRSRLDEGRRSLLPKVEKLIQERLEPVIAEQRGTLTATLEPEALTALQEELPAWARAWGDYALKWVDVDLDRTIHQLWHARTGDLPVPPPAFAPLEEPAINAHIEIPAVRLDRKNTGLGSGIYRHARSVLYGVMSITLLLGLRGGQQEEGSLWVLVLPVVLVGAVAFGYLQAQAERQQERARLAEDVRRKADAATREVLRAWIDRSADRLHEEATRQLEARRDAFVDWYRNTVVPAQNRVEQDAARRTLAAEAARRELPRHQEQARQLARAQEALEALAAATAAS